MLKSFWSYMLSAVEESLAILLLLIIGDALPRPTSRWARARHDKSALRQKAPQQSQAFLPCSSARKLELGRMAEIVVLVLFLFNAEGFWVGNGVRHHRPGG